MDVGVVTEVGLVAESADVGDWMGDDCGGLSPSRSCEVLMCGMVSGFMGL